MMHAHAPSLMASAITRNQMGLQSNPYGYSHSCDGVTRPHRNLGAVDTVALKSIGIDATTAFIQSGFDVDALYEPAFKTLTTLSLAIPAPGGQLVAAGISVAKLGTDAMRNAIKAALRASATYLPVGVSQKVATDIVTLNTKNWWSRVCRDKFAQHSGESILAAAAIAAYNKLAQPENQLNTTIRTRTADQLYTVARKYGATEWQAAMAAYKVCVNMGAIEAGYKYAAMVGNASNPEAAWNEKVGKIGGKKVNADQAEDVLEGKRQDTAKKASGGGGGLAIGAIGLAALAALASR